MREGVESPAASLSSGPASQSGLLDLPGPASSGPRPALSPCNPSDPLASPLTPSFVHRRQGEAPHIDLSLVSLLPRSLSSSVSYRRRAHTHPHSTPQPAPGARLSFAMASQPDPHGAMVAAKLCAPSPARPPPTPSPRHGAASLGPLLHRAAPPAKSLDPPTRAASSLTCGLLLVASAPPASHRSLRRRIWLCLARVLPCRASVPASTSSASPSPSPVPSLRVAGALCSCAACLPASPPAPSVPVARALEERSSSSTCARIRRPPRPAGAPRRSSPPFGRSSSEPQHRPPCTREDHHLQRASASSVLAPLLPCCSSPARPLPPPPLVATTRSSTRSPEPRRQAPCRTPASCASIQQLERSPVTSRGRALQVPRCPFRFIQTGKFDLGAKFVFKSVRLHPMWISASTWRPQ